MNTTAIVTDTNSGITPEIAKEHGIYLLKMPFMVGGEEYIEYGDISHEDFFKLLEEGAEVSTSQPAPGALIKIWEEALKTHSSVIYIPMSSALSGTCETAKALATDYNGKVFVVNNKRISVTLYELVMDALYLAKSGMLASEIADILENDGEHQSIYVSVNTLEHLKKSGRVTAAGAAIGTLLGIKPVLQIQRGQLDAYKKVRGMKAAMDAMLDGVENDISTKFQGKSIHIRAAYSGDKVAGDEWRNILAEHFPDYEIGLDALPLSISCHVGGGAMGVGVAEIKYDVKK